MTLTTTSKWLFPVSALSQTPSVQCSGISLQKELYDRSRGIEFLYRLGSTLLLSVPVCNGYPTSPLSLFLQLAIYDDHRCHLVPSVLHEEFDSRLSQTGLAPSVMSKPTSRRPWSCRKSPQPVYFLQQRPRNVVGNFAMSHACL